MTSNFDQTVYLSNKLDTMTSNFAGMREHVLVERSETAKKRSVVKQLVSEFMSRVAWTEVRTWRLYQLLWLLLVPRNPVRPQNRKMLFASAMSMSRLLLCPSATSQLAQRTIASCYFRVLQGHLCQQHEQSDERSVYKGWAYNSWEVWSNFQLCHTFEGMGLQIVVIVINCCAGVCMFSMNVTHCLSADIVDGLDWNRKIESICVWYTITAKSLLARRGIGSLLYWNSCFVHVPLHSMFDRLLLQPDPRAWDCYFICLWTICV